MSTGSLKRRARIEAVPIEKMRVRHGVSQREFRPAWASEIARELSIEKLGTPILNHAGDCYWIVDGQHRIEAVKLWLGDAKGQRLDCVVYEGLSEEQEAELFLGLNRVRSVRAFDKFKIALTASRPDETAIDRIVRGAGLSISENGGSGSLACVVTLARVFRRSGGDGLAQTIRIAHEAFGDEGLESDIIDGLGLLASRYNGQLEPRRAIAALSAARGGLNALRSRATRLSQQTGTQRSQCIAAAVVEVYNRGKGGKKLPSWWKSETAS